MEYAVDQVYTEFTDAVNAFSSNGIVLVENLDGVGDEVVIYLTETSTEPISWEEHGGADCYLIRDATQE